METFCVEFSSVPEISLAQRRAVLEAAEKAEYKWASGISPTNQIINEPFYTFTIENHIIRCGYWKNDNPVLTPEEAIEFFGAEEKPEFKKNDYVIIDKSNDESYIGNIFIFIETAGTPLYYVEYRLMDLHGESYTFNSKFDELRHPTPEEIESRLIKEAEKRGYKNGQKVRPCYDSSLSSWLIGGSPIKYTKWVYKPDEDKLFCFSTCIYCKGNWAEIIEDKIMIEGCPVEKVSDSVVKVYDSNYSLSSLRSLTSLPRFVSAEFKTPNGTTTVTKKTIDKIIERFSK